MANSKLRLEVELENLNNVIVILKDEKMKKNHSKLELAGIATYIHNFYNGVENILKQTLKTKDIIIDDSAYWHKELIERSVKEKLITKELSEDLADFMSFRHFFVHSYSFILNEKKLKELHKKIFRTYDKFLEEIKKFTD